ncbi:VIT1/CCC1 transporter family protein [Agrococcus jenensis]|uniref:VIT1/CCC1 family predicted Fe2+/Mn2+ transporter n=1 Tax=Agrococcus jenensis TaxID=46353 RepID=A0A3N2ASU6_9MICO|nr:VIT family protein [Agrococcus jenensis]ROR66117.1 VIT1/CCC1 family predicted Fe2+/Mn2+ transporter [Agrococcus jenensis]
MDPALQRRPDLPPPVESMASRLNWLRAGVLGANDGIVSTSALMVGVAGAGTTLAGILTAGIAALVAGAFSMAVGEYVSVSSQRDSERAAIRRELRHLDENPEGQIDQLAHMYELRGLSPETAHLVAAELTASDPLRAHLDVEYKLDPEDLNNPWAAAASSAVAFTLGSLVPLLAALLSPAAWMPWSIVVATIVALLVTGIVSARIGGSGKRLGTLRVLLGGIIALAATWSIGTLLGSPVH